MASVLNRQRNERSGEVSMPGSRNLAISGAASGCWTWVQTTGFSLLEMVLVLAIFGIVAATALPRMTNVTSSTRIQAVHTQARAFQAGVNGIHAAWRTRAQRNDSDWNSATTINPIYPIHSEATNVPSNVTSYSTWGLQLFYLSGYTACGFIYSQRSGAIHVGPICS